VDYIVENTVGKLIEGKTLKQVEKIKICDPACGSGSFLIGAYQYLLNYHLKYYTVNPPKKKKDNPLTPEGNLTTAEKKRILLNNIFGLDIDPQAVEVTKLNLLLKAMEGETQASISCQLKLFHDRVLPNLSNNIKCGNSLIGNDFYDNQPTLFPEQIKKINAFDWEKGFSEIFENGGFDVVIGNPPYGAEFENEIKHFLSLKYDLPIPIADTFIMFLKRAFDISKKNAIISYIIPSTWLYMPQYLTFRKELLNQYQLDEIQLFRKPVFENVTVETCTIISTNKKFDENSKFYFKEIKSDPNKFIFEGNIVLQKTLEKENEPNLVLSKNEDKSLFIKIQNENHQLKEVALTVCGLTPYRLGKGKPPQNSSIVQERAFDADYKKDINYRRYLMGRDFHRYCWQIEKERWISYGDWLAEPRYKAPFNDEKKIIIRQTADNLIAHIDTNKFLSLKNVHNLRINQKDLTYEYLLGLLNSKLLDWWYQKLIPERGRVFAEVKVVNRKKLPIKLIDFSVPKEKQAHDTIVQLVDNLLNLNKELQKTKIETQRNQLQRAIDHSEMKIDELVYELYGLSEEEIKIVEEKL